MIDSGKRYCDRCGKILTKDNNKCGYEVCDKCNEYLEQSNKFFNFDAPMVKKSMEQDAVSRDAVMGLVAREHTEWDDLYIDIAKLPSVTQKSGKWITDARTYYEELNKRGLGVDEYTPYFTDDIACSECLAKYNTIDNETEFFKYCPNCGAKMESEDKE